ncbi:unnamed protein product [Clonostachys solani]|uniref:Protein NO VEIN C-terminal domain-containing protein n=1 Tax=Clonostachys solani TaxID=160281 RepID=A0A9N9W5G0_9HYPO|nr:unnamed protein product [Clonostachys solani]
MATNGTMSSLDIHSARQLVEKIAEDHGFISERELATLPEAMRQKITRAFNLKDSIIGSGAVTLARNLYSSTARFIFELLQNADDNSYKATRQAGGDPCVSFSVYPDRLVLECNEDGFTAENVRAICNLGKSSKKGAQGYIGEKGIGFKSVFIAAWKVEIQSGALSFYFQHRKQDTGIGMINPIWFDPETTLPANTTRMTLHFHEDVKQADIVQLLRNLQVEILLFLQKLKVINISVYGEHNESPAWSRVVRMKRSDPSSDTAEIRVKETGSSANAPGQSVYRFFVVRHEAKNLQPNENRQYDAKETEKKAWSTSQVIVAFPLDKNSQPIIQSQELFAFMPVRRVGFNFLVHADFVTQANRQDIVSTSPRNIGLRAAISDAVAKGLASLSTLRSVRYIWMRYLPRHDSLPQDPFWAALVPEIRKSLGKVPILEPESQETGARYYLASLKCLRPEHLDQQGKPLIPDISMAPLYLTRNYKPEDSKILMEYGLEYLNDEGIIPRLSALTKSTTWYSGMFDSRDEDWQARLARLIVKILSIKESNVILGLPLIPLTSKVLRGRHVIGASLFGSDVYFPESDGVAIPQDLSVQLILPEAAANKDCASLYEKLQAKRLSPQRVYSLIVERHNSSEPVPVESSNNHIRYLYRVFHHLNQNSHQLHNLKIVDHKGQTRLPLFEYTYLPGDKGDKYSPSNWSTPMETSGGSIIESNMSLIHPSYLENRPETNQKLGKSWVKWLYHDMHLEISIQVLARIRRPETLSSEFRFLVEHRSPKVISYLCAKWASSPSFAEFWLSIPQRIQLLKECEFIDQSGVKRPLASTYLPVPSLVSRCSSFISDPGVLPFLEVEDPIIEGTALGWEGVGKAFTLGVTDDLDFYLKILEAINCGDSGTTESLTASVTKLYLRIHARCLASDDRQAAQKRVREFFDSSYGVLCSPSQESNDEVLEHEDAQDGSWANTHDCLWDAPPGFESKEPVGARWKTTLANLDPQDRDSLEQFFRRTVGIRDVESQDVLDELILQSSSDSPSLDVLGEIYNKLSEMLTNMEMKGDSLSLKKIKLQFATEPLIFIPSNKETKWFSTGGCLWSVDGEKLGKPCLERHYPDLSAFFVNILGVRKLDLKLIINELQDIGDNVISVTHAENLLKSLKIYLASHSGEKPKLEDKALLSRVFPAYVPGHTQVQLLSAKDEFAIADRQSYLDALQPHISVLKFTVAEAQQLAPVFEWMGLATRNLSRVVDERTVVGEDGHQLDGELTRDLILKAGAFVSIASHFESPLAASSTQSLYSSLRKLRVYSAQDINTKLCIKQNEQEVQIPIGKGVLHIDTSEHSDFKIFITADESTRDFCITSKLPHHFAASLLGCTTSEVTDKILSVVSSVIHGRPKSMSLILQEKGIPELDQSSLGESDDEDIEGLGLLQSSSSGELVLIGKSPPRRSKHDFTHWAEDSTSYSAGSSTMDVLNNYSEYYNASRELEAYKRLLVRVVEVARQHTIPLDSESVFNMNSLTRSLDSSSNYNFAGRDDKEFKYMVGAAGELFIFESLLKLQLPDFDIGVWRSNVRRFVKAHPDYENIPDTVFYGAGDITYHDRKGELTKNLIQRGFLDASWQESTPEYLILTKTSPSEKPDLPFYMTNDQYIKMEEYLSIQRLDTKQKRQACILFRVYGLMSGNIRVKVCTDIDLLRQSGELKFVSDGWTVHPHTKGPN